MNIREIATKFDAWQQENREKYVTNEIYDPNTAFVGFIFETCNDELKRGVDLGELRTLAALLKTENRIENSEKLTIESESTEAVLARIKHALKQKTLNKELVSFVKWMTSNESGLIYFNATNLNAKTVILDYVKHQLNPFAIESYADFCELSELIKNDLRLNSKMDSLEIPPCSEEEFKQCYEPRLAQQQELQRATMAVLMRHLDLRIILQAIMLIFMLVRIFININKSPRIEINCTNRRNYNMFNEDTATISCVTSSSKTEFEKFIECLSEENNPLSDIEKDVFMELSSKPDQLSAFSLDIETSGSSLVECGKQYQIKGNYEKWLKQEGFLDKKTINENSNNTASISTVRNFEF